MTNPQPAIIARWTDPERRPLFKGKLIDESACCCAQGDILRHECAMSDDALRAMTQDAADRKVAETIGISLFHSILLRQVNDRKDGCPQDVLGDPEKVLGPNAALCLRFGWWIDRMGKEDWKKVVAARAAAEDAACDAAAAGACAAWDAAWHAAGAAAYSAGDAAGTLNAAQYAMLEIMGAAVMREKGQPFFFLPMFGFASPEEIPEV